MTKYIEREAACTAMPDDYYGWRDKQILNFIPAADVVPVRHGRWIWTETGEEDYEQYWICSACGEKSYWQAKFCSECGARMDGDA